MDVAEVERAICVAFGPQDGQLKVRRAVHTDGSPLWLAAGGQRSYPCHTDRGRLDRPHGRRARRCRCRCFPPPPPRLPAAVLLDPCRRRPAASDSAPARPPQEQATAYLNQLSGSPEGWKFCVDRFTPTAYAEVKFWCLRTLHEVRGRAAAVPARRLATCRCMLAPAPSCGRCYVQQRGFLALSCSCVLELTHAALPDTT